MQFFTIATVLFTVASGVMAAPAPSSESMEPFRLQARTCGTLTGKPLQVCQGVCKAACSAIPVSLAKKACQKSCMLGPLKARDVDASVEAEAEDDGTDDDEDDTFDAVDFEAFGQLRAEDGDEAAGLQAREPLTGGQVCRAACAVTCNSTVLALRQKWCLEKCNGKCPAN